MLSVMAGVPSEGGVPAGAPEARASSGNVGVVVVSGSITYPTFLDEALAQLVYGPASTCQVQVAAESLPAWCALGRLVVARQLLGGTVRLRRALLTIPALAALLTGAVTTSAAAGVVPRPAPAECGVGTIIKDGPVIEYNSAASIGQIYLVQYGHDYWACVDFNANLTEGYWGMARLHIIDSGKHVGSLHCDFPTGNGHVTKGQDTCYSSRSNGEVGYRTYIAEGNFYKGLASQEGRGTTGTSTR